MTATPGGSARRATTAALRKYITAFSLSFRSQIAYRFDVFLSVAFTIGKILLAYVLWTAIYNGRELVGGFTLNGMICYYILCAFISQLDMSSSMADEISSRIRGGTFSAYMTRPMSAEGYFCAQTAGASAYYLSFNLLAALAWMLVFGIRPELAMSAGLWLGAAAMIALGLWFMMQFHFLLGILAFKYLDVWVFLMIKNNIMALATGTLIPLMLLPQTLVQLMRLLPFYYISYLPTMLMMGRCADEAITGLITLLVWNVALLPLNKWLFARMRKRYDGVGI